MTKIRPKVKEILDQIVNENLPGVEILKKVHRPTHDEMQKYPNLKKVFIHVDDKMFIINTDVIHD